MKTFYLTLFLWVCICAGSTVSAQNPIDTVSKKTGKPSEDYSKKKWYDKLSFGGYTHLRYNRFLETNPLLKCAQCDGSWGQGGAISIRRARLKVSGDVHERVYVYIQLDLANALSVSSAGMNQGYVQIRDLYFDLALDKKKEFRLRPGVSKVPFSFDVLQSSQNRIALDRSDAMNSGAPNERDLGLFFYWAPEKIRERFHYLVKSGLKGSGDYGVFGLGVYNGQSLNKPDLNENFHLVSRLTYPIKLGDKQIIEPAIYGYTGYINMKDLRSSIVKAGTTYDFKDERAGASIVVYPQPLGFQAEYMVGRGPDFVNKDTSIQLRNLQGGYAQVMYQLKVKEQIFFPYARGQYYKGGKKHEMDARHYEVHELEFGVEWQPIPAFELTTAYLISKRTFEDSAKPINTQRGNLLRLQLQFNY
jgi:hypothetical protein